MLNLTLLQTLHATSKSSYQIISLFDRCIDMDERISGKQDRPNLIIEAPRAPK